MVLPPKFVNALHTSRLGKEHESYKSFHSNVYNKEETRKQKEYTLIVIVQSPSSKNNRKRILLGMKNRGFGKGFYNSFGGKLDPKDASITHGAIRELQEETNISVSINIMKKSFIGKLHFTFDDDEELEMIIHLFMIDLNKDLSNWDDCIIQECDEITPVWFNDWNDIPLNQMFADDSIWLTALLSSYESTNYCSKLKFNGWFHYDAGGTDVNSILHYYLEIQDISLEKRMFHALNAHNIRNPTIKEFKECWAFVNTVKYFLNKSSFDVVIDVAGGCGTLAALFLSLTTATEGIVIDPAIISSGINGIDNAWRSTFFSDKVLRYRHERLQTALADELEIILQSINCMRVLVVACHACQHLTQDTINIAERYGVHIAVMPCCQKDVTGSWKSFCNKYNSSNNNNPNSLDIGTVMDLLTAGKMMNSTAGLNAGVSYIVKMKMIDKCITPHNRIILCKAVDRSVVCDTFDEKREKIEMNLNKAYSRAHSNSIRKGVFSKDDIMRYLMQVQCVAIGIGVGIMISSISFRSK